MKPTDRRLPTLSFTLLTLVVGLLVLTVGLIAIDVRIGWTRSLFDLETRILAHLIRLPEQTHLWVARLDRPQLPNRGEEGEIATRISGEFIARLAADIRTVYSSRGLGR